MTLPLLRELPSTTGSSSSASTNKSLIATTRDIDHSITELRTRVVGQKVSLHGFDIDTKDPVLQEMGRVLKASVTTCLVNWYGMKVVPLGQKASVIVCNETEPTALHTLVTQIPRQKNNPSIVVLCAHDTRFDHTPHLEDAKCNISYVAKPVGPLKLAKAITACLDGLPPSATPGIDSSLSQIPENSDLNSTFDSLTISPRGGEILDNSRMSADSENARKAIESPTPNATTEKEAEFPFPTSPPDNASPIPGMPHGSTMPATKGGLMPFAASVGQAASSTLVEMEKATAKLLKPVSTKVQSPTFLLVDDNHINMKLLSTYINRRNFEIVHQAQNGLEAVQHMQARKEGYNIIFMDITMPILDGFGATSQIRAIEESRRKASSEDKGAAERKPALIIAFTGRSSMEDQAEAMRVGIDLFMTKPVAFKEVGKMIDNWMANRERVEGA